MNQRLTLEMATNFFTIWLDKKGHFFMNSVSKLFFEKWLQPPLDRFFRALETFFILKKMIWRQDRLQKITVYRIRANLSKIKNQKLILKIIQFVKKIESHKSYLIFYWYILRKQINYWISCTKTIVFLKIKLTTLVFYHK